MQLSEYTIEIMIMAGFGISSWFFRGVLSSLKEIRQDLHKIASSHGERIARLEVTEHQKKCHDFDFRRRVSD